MAHKPGNDVWNLQVFDDKHLITCGSEKICLWEIDTGKKVKTIDPNGSVKRLGVVPGKRQFVTAGPDHHVRLWDIDKEKVIREYDGHREDVYDVRVTQDGKKLITAGSSEKIVIFDLESAEELVTLDDHDNSVVTIAIHPDQSRFLSCSNDHSIRCWSLKNYSEIWVGAVEDEATIVQWSRTASKL